MSDGGRTKVLVPYVNLQKQIKRLLPESRPPLHKWHLLIPLQKTLCSMKLMVYDMEQSANESPRRSYIDEFLNLVNETKISIDSPPSSSFMLKLKLESITKRMKQHFQNYVIAELVAGSSEVADEQVEMELKRLVKFLGSTIRFKITDDTSNRSNSNRCVFRNIEIILDNISQESEKRDLLELLNQVKVLLKFRNGDHGIDIPDHLHTCEKRLRKHFVTEVGLAELKRQEQKDKAKNNEELKWFYIIVGGIAIAIFFQNKNPIALLIAVCCCFIAYCAYVDGSSSKSTNSSDQNNLNERKKYDIFLNFRGTDVRNGLAGLFYSSFEKENISIFFDENSIPKSAIFWEAIKTGINNSIGAITIFSKNYANSEDCLDELVLIKQRAERVQEDGGTYKIRPIFYDIPTADLEPPRPRNPEPESKFRQDLKNHDKQDKLVEWEAAVSYALTINGDPYESERQQIYMLINDVVQDFKNYVQTRGIQ